MCVCVCVCVCVYVRTHDILMLMDCMQCKNHSLLTGRYLDNMEDVLLMIHLFTILDNCRHTEKRY